MKRIRELKFSPSSRRNWRSGAGGTAQYNSPTNHAGPNTMKVINGCILDKQQRTSWSVICFDEHKITDPVWGARSGQCCIPSTRSGGRANMGYARGAKDGKQRGALWSGLRAARQAIKKGGRLAFNGSRTRWNQSIFDSISEVLHNLYSKIFKYPWRLSCKRSKITSSEPPRMSIAMHQDG